MSVVGTEFACGLRRPPRWHEVALWTVLVVLAMADLGTSLSCWVSITAPR